MRKRIALHDQSVKEVIAGISDSLNTPYEESEHECCLKLPEAFGTGHVRTFQFDFGIGVVEMDYLLKKAVHFELKKGVVHPLKIIFNRESAFDHRFAGNEESHHVRRLESAMISSTPENNHIFKIPANTPVCTFSIEINRKLFEEKIALFLPDMNTDLITLFRDVNGVNPFYYKNYYSLDIAGFIEEFTQCELTGFMRQVYLEGKAYEILTHQLQQYLDDLNEPDKRQILRKATVERIEEVVAIIQEEIESVDNITNLARRVGLNQNTLQNGFKHLYKSSVNEYIRNYRIDKAKELIESSDLNITEITYKVGINSRSYFAKIFKKRFGITPRQYLDQIRNKKGTSSSA